MDRRQRKTREAIFTAFISLLERKNYSSITVQEIIDEADVGRSTFYAHFETKDELIREMCTEIFGHVFAPELPKEATHDFSSESKNLQNQLAHILYHLRDEKKDLAGILSCESSEIFMKYFKQYLNALFEKYIAGMNKDIPEGFILNHLVGGFAEAVSWWVRRDMRDSPEDIAGYFCELSNIF